VNFRVRRKELTSELWNPRWLVINNLLRFIVVIGGLARICSSLKLTLKLGLQLCAELWVWLYCESPLWCACLIFNCLSRTRLTESAVCSLSLAAHGRMLSFVSVVFQKPYSTIDRKFKLIWLWQVFALIIFSNHKQFLQEIRDSSSVDARNLWDVRIGKRLSNTRGNPLWKLLSTASN